MRSGGGVPACLRPWVPPCAAVLPPAGLTCFSLAWPPPFSELSGTSSVETQRLHGDVAVLASARLLCPHHPGCFQVLITCVKGRRGQGSEPSNTGLPGPLSPRFPGRLRGTAASAGAALVHTPSCFQCHRVRSAGRASGAVRILFPLTATLLQLSVRRSPQGGGGQCRRAQSAFVDSFKNKSKATERPSLRGAGPSRAMQPHRHRRGREEPSQLPLAARLLSAHFKIAGRCCHVGIEGTGHGEKRPPCAPLSVLPITPTQLGLPSPHTGCWLWLSSLQTRASEQRSASPVLLFLPVGRGAADPEVLLLLNSVSAGPWRASFPVGGFAVTSLTSLTSRALGHFSHGVLKTASQGSQVRWPCV